MLRFGTDGVRGDAEADLTSDLITNFGRAVARVLHPPAVLIGRDTRASGSRIEADVAAGLDHEAVTPVLLGVMPTPAIAFLAAQHELPAAIVSASHNPWTDNGVKIIGADGYKLDDATEATIERELADLPRAESSTEASHRTLDRALDEYEAHLMRALDGRSLNGLDIVLDCANGAAFEIAPRVFHDAGASVTTINAAPDGRNINAACGSTHPQALQRAVQEQGAQLGFAFDGDADRVLAVDEHGVLVDGDQIMLMTALDLQRRGALPGNAIALTVMSNLGLRNALADAQIEIVETPVGDRYVVEAMRARTLAIGGEQSGHIIYAEHATTGDGLLTALLVADLVVRSGTSLSSLAGAMTRAPQVLVNVRGRLPDGVAGAPALADAVRRVESELGRDGRVLVRASGTEPIIRIMVEAKTLAVAEAAAQQLQSVVEAELDPA